MYVLWLVCFFFAKAEEDWKTLAKNYYWFALEENGDMHLFERSKGYLAKSIPGEHQFETIDCNGIIENANTIENLSTNHTSYDLILSILPHLRKKSHQSAPTLEQLKPFPSLYRIALDICFSEDLSHDTLGGVFPMTRFLEGSLFHDARSHGTYEIIDDPDVMASTMATEKLIDVIKETLPDDGNIAVVVSSNPRNTALENESYYIFNQTERFYNYPLGQQTELGGTIYELLSLPKQEQNMRLEKLPVSTILWTHIEKQKTVEGDAFYINHSRIITPQKSVLELKHMGFSINRTGNYWPMILVIGLLYFFTVLYFYWLCSPTESRSETNPLKEKLKQVLHIPFWGPNIAFLGTETEDAWRIFCVNQEETRNFLYKRIARCFWLTPLIGLFSYLFLESIFEPLQPPLENLWFVSFWWPFATIFGLILTPIFAYWPIKRRIRFFENISQELTDLFPIISSLAIYGSFLHLIGDLFLIYNNPWELAFATISVHWFVLWLIILLRIYSSIVPISVLMIFSFFYLTTTQPYYLFALAVLSSSLHGLYVRGRKIESTKTQEEMKIFLETCQQQPIKSWRKTVLETTSAIENFVSSHSEPYILFHSTNSQAAPYLFLAKIREKLCSVPYFSSLNHEEIITFIETDQYNKRACLQKLFHVELEHNSRFFDNELDDTKEIHKLFSSRKICFYIENYHYIDSQARQILESILEWSKKDNDIQLCVIATSSKSDKHNMKNLPLLRWKEIQSIISRPLSKPIINWIEKEIPDSEVITFPAICHKIQELFRHHNQRLKKQGKQIHFVSELSIHEIVSHSKEEKIHTQTQSILAAYSQNKDLDGILLFEFFRNYHTESDVFVAIDEHLEIDTHLNQIEAASTFCYFYESIKKATHHIFSIPSHATSLPSVVQTLRTNVNLSLRLRKIEEKIPKEHPAFTPFLSFVFHILTHQDHLDIHFINVQSHYHHSIKLDILTSITQLGEVFIKNKDLVLDSKIHLLIQSKHVNGIRLTTHPERLSYLTSITQLLDSHPNASIAQQTWLFILNKLHKGKQDPLSKKDLVLLDNIEQRYRKSSKPTNEFYLQTIDILETSANQKTRTDIYIAHQIEYSLILIRNREEENYRVHFIQNLYSYIKNLNHLCNDTKRRPQLSSQEKNDLETVKIHAKNKVFWLEYKILRVKADNIFSQSNPAEKTKQLQKIISSIEELEQKIYSLIADRIKYNKDSVDFDYALLREILHLLARTHEKSDPQRSLQYTMDSFHCSISSLVLNVSNYQKVTSLHTRLKQQNIIRRHIIRSSQLVIALQKNQELDNTIHQDIENALQEIDIDVQTEMILQFFLGEHRKKQNISRKEFWLQSLLSICTQNKDALFLFDFEQACFAFTYLYLMKDDVKDIHIDNSTVIEKITREIQKDYTYRGAKNWFMHPVGIVLFCTKSTDHSQHAITQHKNLLLAYLQEKTKRK